MNQVSCTSKPMVPPRWTLLAMISRGWTLFHFLLFVKLDGLTITNAQKDWDQNCSESNKYMYNSPYEQRLTDALIDLPTTNNGYGFFNSTSSQENSDSPKAIALCRGDTPPDVCQRCVDDATRRLKQVCPVQKECTGWYELCYLRYSNSSILGTLDQSGVWFHWADNNIATDVKQFNQALSNLLDRLRGEAAREGSFRKYATGTRNYMSGLENSTIYGIMQCTPDLSESQCNQCLKNVTQRIQLCCDGNLGVRAYLSNCCIRYERYLFYNKTWLPSLASPPPPPPDIETIIVENSEKIAGNYIESICTFRKKEKIIVASTIAAVAVISILVFFVFYYLHRRRKRKEIEPLSSGEDSNHQLDKDDTFEMSYFSLSTIQSATNDFSVANKLGEGGFGPVYKGVLQDGKEIAVKRLSRKSGQGVEEFKTEVRLVIKLQHKNLVRLLGYCIKGDEKLLVYEYMANTSLDAFLFDSKKCKELDWSTRANIVSGIAKGLRYLHEDSCLKIVHRDMKTSNVLLDEEMNPKISDFGTARIFGGKQIEASTNRVVGTLGYMAPEYAMEGLFSVKSDVYSFGVLLHEIISGKKNSDFHHEDHVSLPSFAWSLWKEKKGEKFIDENLIGNCPLRVSLRWMNIALLCVQEDPSNRPTMSSVVFMLEDQWTSLSQPLPPPFSVGRFVSFDQSSTTGVQRVSTT